MAADAAGRVKRWEVGTGKIINEIRQEGEYCYALRCTVGGEGVMTGGDDGVEVFNMEGGERKWSGDVGGTVMDLRVGTMGTVFAGTRG